MRRVRSGQDTKQFERHKQITLRHSMNFQRVISISLYFKQFRDLTEELTVDKQW